MHKYIPGSKSTTRTESGQTPLIKHSPGYPCALLLLCLLMPAYAESTLVDATPSADKVSSGMEQPVDHAPTMSQSGPVLTMENSTYIIFDQHQREHAFRRLPNGDFDSLGNTSGALVQININQFQWIAPSGTHHQFSGSTLVSSRQMSTRARRPRHDKQPTGGGQDTTLQSGPQRLRAARLGECTPDANLPPEESNNDLSSSPVSRPPSPASDSNQQATQQPNAQAPEPTVEQPVPDEESLQCDIDESGPHSFLPVSYNGPQTTLDARPQSCESYFVQYYGTQRGLEIEAGLQLHAPYDTMQATLRTFPIIDFIDESTFYVVHSRDLGNRTFNSPARPDALFDQLMNDGEDIQTRFVDVLYEQGSISASELGQTTAISIDQLKPITLQLVIRDGIASAAHWEQIARAREELMLRYGITLEIVIIP